MVPFNALHHFQRAFRIISHFLQKLKLRAGHKNGLLNTPATIHDNMHTLAGVDGHPDKPEWEGDMKYYIIDSEGRDRIDSHVASYYASWDKLTHLVSTNIQDANTVTLADGLEMRTSQFDSINKRVNQQVLLDDGSIERFCVPIHTTGNTDTDRMIVRVIHPGDEIEIKNQEFE
jgi:hypothetical protein